MDTYLKGTIPYEGRKLTGSPEEIESILDWIALTGLPRLVDPTPEVEPFMGFRMVDSRGVRFTPGFYINPDKGCLVIRNRYKRVLYADYGDWLMRDLVSSNINVVKQPAFEFLFTPVP